MIFAALSQLPSPGSLEGWEEVGIVGILVAVLIAMISGAVYALKLWLDGRIVSGRVHAEVKEERDEALRELRYQSREAMRREDDLKALARDVVMHGLVSREKRDRNDQGEGQ